MNMNQKVALIEFLVMYYHNVHSISTFTLDFLDKHSKIIEEYIFKPFTIGGLEAINSAWIERIAMQYQAERNAYLI